MIKKLIRLCAYLLAIFVILCVAAIGVFYFAKPHFSALAEQKLANYKIKAESSEIALPGKLIMHDVTLPTPPGITVKVQKIAARPPLPFIPGAANIENMTIQYRDFIIFIPTLDAGGISENDKDMSTNSKVLQALSRFNLSSLSIPEMKVISTRDAGSGSDVMRKEDELITISGFSLSKLSKGKIGYIAVDHIESNIPLSLLAHAKASTADDDIDNIIDDSAKPSASTPPLSGHVSAKSGALSARDLDLAYGYALLSGRPTEQKEAYIFKNIDLAKIAIDFTNPDNQNINFALGQLKSDGLRMKTPSAHPEDMLRAIAVAKNAGDKNAEKEAIKHFVITILQAVSAVDVDVSQVAVKAPDVNVSLDSLRVKPDNWKDNFIIPQNMQLAINKLSFGGATLPGEAGELLEMFGLNKFDISGQANYRYDAGKKLLDIEDMSFTTGDLATGHLKAKIINVNEDVFKAKPEALTGAINTIGMSEMSIQYQDNGLIDHMFDHLSKDIQPSNPVAMKKELYDDLKLMLVDSAKSLLKEHGNMQKIADSLGRFADKPGKLDITMKAKDSHGLTFADIAGTTGNENQDGLSLLLKKVDLTVSER